MAGSSRPLACDNANIEDGTVGGVFLLHVIAYDMVRLANILKAKVAVA